MARAVSPARHTCAFCTALQRLAIRRRDFALVEAGIRLRETANDAEPEAFTRRLPWTRSPERPGAGAGGGGVGVGVGVGVGATATATVKVAAEVVQL